MDTLTWTNLLQGKLTAILREGGEVERERERERGREGERERERGGERTREGIVRYTYICTQNTDF